MLIEQHQAIIPFGGLKVAWKVGRFPSAPPSILWSERLGAKWIHKNLLDLSIQQERQGTRRAVVFVKM